MAQNSEDVRRTNFSDAVDVPKAPVMAASGGSTEEAASMTLAEAVEYGLRRNPRLAQEAAKVAGARAGETIAFAPFLPEVNFKYQLSAYNAQVLPSGNFVPASLRAGVYSFSLAEIGTQYTLADFGRRAGAYGQSTTATRIQALMLQRAKQAIAFQVVDAYLQVLGAEARLRVRDEALERSRALRKDVGARRRQGSVETESELEANVGDTRSEAEIVEARQSVQDARSLLNLALGRRFCEPLALRDETRRPPFSRSLDQCLEVALNDRDEIGVARQEVAAAGFGEESARGEYLPKMVVRAGVIRADAPKFLHTWLVGTGLYAEQTLFAGGRVNGGLQRAKAAALEAFAGLNVITDSVTNQVNLAYNAIATARERVRLGEVGLVQAHENLRVRLVRYRNGDAILSDIIAAETGYTAAQANFVTAVYDYLAALARLEYAQGGNQRCLLEELERTPESPATRFEKPLPPLTGPLSPGMDGPPTGGTQPDPVLPPALPDLD